MHSLTITAIAAQSIDGFITRHEEPGTAFTSEADKAWFREALSSFDAIVMGRRTYEVSRSMIREHLSPARLRIVLTHKPELFTDDLVPGQLEFSAKPPRQLVAELAAKGKKHCALLGGSQIYWEYLDQGLVDQFWISLEPLIFGSGTPLVADGALDARFQLRSVERMGENTVLLRYARKV